MHSIRWNVRGVPEETTSSHHSCRVECSFVLLVWKKGQKYLFFYKSNSPCTKTMAWYFAKFVKRKFTQFPNLQGLQNKSSDKHYHISPGKSMYHKYISERIRDLAWVSVYPCITLRLHKWYFKA